MKQFRRFSILCYSALFIIALNVNAQQNKSSIADYQNKIQTWLAIYKVPAVGIGMIEDGSLE